MNVTTKLDMDKVDYSKENIVNLRLGLEAPELPEDFERNSAFIVAVLDKSGSMGMGDRFIRLQETMVKLIENLTSQDRLGIVWFGDGASSEEVLVMNAEGKELARQIISSADCRDGHTDIEAGLLKASELLGPRQHDVTEVEKILLLTDGGANAGVTSLEGLTSTLASVRATVGLSCFGYGSDYNEHLLEGLSTSRAGASHFIENSDMLAGAFGEELGGMLSRYSTQTTVKISISTDDGEFVEMLNNFPMGEDQGAGNVIIRTVNMGDVMYDETKNLFVRIKVPAKSSPETIKNLVLATVNGFEDGGKSWAGESHVDLHLVEASEVGLPDEEIAEQVLVLDAAKTQVSAKDLADKGEWQAAKELFDAMIDRLEDYDTDYTNNYAKMMRTTSEGLNSTYVAGGMYSKSMSNIAATTMSYRGTGGTMMRAMVDNDSRIGSTKNAFTQSIVDEFEDDEDQDKS